RAARGQARRRAGARAAGGTSRILGDVSDRLIGGFGGSSRRRPPSVRTYVRMTMPSAQLSLDGADRLVGLLADRRAPIGLTEAAGSLFALRGAPPSALVRQLVDEVVRTDARLIWRS